MEQLLPSSGAILDWGCGHGLLDVWAATRSPGRSVVGVDIDARKVATARLASEAAGVGGRTWFTLIPPDSLPEGRWDAIVLDDVAYLLEPQQLDALLRRCCQLLLPGGRVIVKDAMGAATWKRRLSALQEQAAVRLARTTATAAGVHPPPSADHLAELLASQGLSVRRIALDRGYHVPHLAVVGERSAEYVDAPRGW
jgi:cyclopropane fatty-acyl-phospholipid synthase-like methyltransferase